MIDLNHMIVVGDLSHRMVDNDDSIGNLWIPDQDEDNMIEVNEEIEVNGQSHQVKNKEKMISLDVLHVHVALVRRED